MRRRAKRSPNSTRALRDKAWTLFSIFTRQNGMDERGFNTCYTCRKRVHWKSANAGHYRHDSHDFDERNVKCQCVYCNLHEGGRADLFYLHLVEDYGQEVADELKNRKKWNGYSRDELRTIIERYS